MKKIVPVAIWSFALFYTFNMHYAFGENTKVIFPCEDISGWRSAAVGGSKVQLETDKKDLVDGEGSMVINYDLKPGEKGGWWYCNLQIPKTDSDWTKFKSISFYLKGDGGTNKIRIGLMDKEGELFLSEKSFNVADKNWRKCEINLNDTDGFYSSDLYQPQLAIFKNAGGLDLESIKEFQIQIQDTWADERKGYFKIDEITLSDKPAQISGEVILENLSEEIGVCQMGYDTAAKKVGVYSTAKKTQKDSFAVITPAGEPVFEGAIKYWGNKWGRRLYLLDFSQFNKNGRYCLKVDNKTSISFEIKNNPWRKIDTNPFFDSFFDFQRCREEKSANPQNADGTHKDLDVNIPIYHVGVDGKETETDKKFPDALGGWHDSTATDKETTMIAWTAHMLLMAYQYNPALFSSTRTNEKVPTPKILDEAKWGLEYLFKIQDRDGGVFLAVKPVDWWQENSLPRRLLDNKCTGVTAKTVAAWACGYRAFKDIKPEFAKECLSHARNGWKWILQHPKDFIPGNVYPSYWTGDASSVTLAACELFLSTKDIYPEEAAEYNSKVTSDIKKGKFGNGVWIHSPYQENFSYVHTALYGQIIPAMCRFYPYADTETKKLIGMHLEKWTTPWFKKVRNNPYGVAENLVKSYFGMNGWDSEVAADMLLAGHTLGNREMTDYGIAQLEWLFGNNPFGLSFVVGYGEKYFPSPFKRPPKRTFGGIIPGTIDFDSNGIIEIAGINEWQTDECTIDYSAALLLDLSLAGIYNERPL